MAFSVVTKKYLEAGLWWCLEIAGGLLINKVDTPLSVQR
jgi:hypothetical protein